MPSDRMDRRDASLHNKYNLGASPSKSRSEKDDRKQPLGPSRSPATLMTASTAFPSRSPLREMQNEQTVKGGSERTDSDNKRNHPPFSIPPARSSVSTRRDPRDEVSRSSISSNRNDRALADSFKQLSIRSDATARTAVNYRRTKPAGSVQHLKFKASFGRFKDFPREASVLARVQNERWINLFQKIRNASSRPSLFNSRMVNSGSSASRNQGSAELLRKVLAVFVMGSRMALEIDIVIGRTNKTNHTLLVDTGSVITWVPAADYIKPRSEADLTKIIDHHDMAPLTYPLMGIELPASVYKDDFEIEDVQVTGQEFAVVPKLPEKFPKAVAGGIFAIGPESQSAGFITNDRSRTIPTVVDNMVRQGKIDANIVVLQFSAWDDTRPQGTDMTGIITFGGIDKGIERGLKYVRAAKSWPARDYYGVDVTMTLAKAPSSKDQTSPPKELFKNRPGIIDSGCPLILLAPDVFNEYIKEVGARLYKDNMWYIKKKNFNRLKNMRFHFLNGDEPVEFDLTPHAQVMPPNYTKRVSEEYLLLLISKMTVPDDMRQWMPTVMLGTVFLQRCIVVYNASKKPAEVMIGIKKGAAADRKWQGLP